MADLGERAYSHAISQGISPHVIIRSVFFGENQAGIVCTLGKTS